jgi:hypothetical protein
MRDIYSAPRVDESDGQLNESQLVRPMYEAKHIALVSILGSPVASAYLAMRNLELMGRSGSGVRWLLCAIIFTLVESYTLIWESKLPGIAVFVFHLLQCGLIYWLANRYFSSAISAHLDDGGELFATSRALVISLIFFFIMLASILIMAWILPGIIRLVLSLFS